MILAIKNAGERTPIRNGQWASSHMGAKGVMQFIDSTRADYPHDPLDPLASIDAAGRYMADLLRQYNGNAMAAIAHYNGGGIPAKQFLAGRPMNDETTGYIKRVRAYLDRTMSQ
jgi:soluble lytic murein transglycosylase-like protein